MHTTYVTPEQHEEFVGRVHASQPAVWLLAKVWFSEQHKKPVRINPYTVTPEHPQWRGHKDDGDLFVLDDGEWRRIEVRNLGYDFTCREDWPHRDFIICTQHTWDEAEDKPYRYYYLNPARTHIGILDPAATRDQWRKRTSPNRFHPQRPDEVYVCDVDLVTFCPLPAGADE